MNASLRDLKSHVDGLMPPPLDIDDIVARGDARLGRRRAALAAGAAGLAVAVAAASAALIGTEKQSDSPIDDPTPTPTVTETPAAAPVRQLTYADVPASQAPNWRIHTIHFGDLRLRLGEVLHMDVTDDGLVVLAPDGAIYFSRDGSSVEQLGTADLGVAFSDRAVKTASVGSLVAWFTPAGPDRSLVVFDTHEQGVVAQAPVGDCVQCALVLVAGDRVYWAESDAPPPGDPLMMLDVPTGTVSRTDSAALAAYQRTLPRGFVKGDSFKDGEVITSDLRQENAYFAPQGSFLELRRLVGTEDGGAEFGYGGFDTTGRRLHLRLPEGYQAAESDYVFFQWLDDDRFAVMSGAAHNDFGWNGFRGYGDILVCDIAEERCTLEAEGLTNGDYRIVPHLDVPN